MKDSRATLRSRNARLNLARKEAAKMARWLEPELRPALGDDDKWAALFANIRDGAADIVQAVHEANAYHNVLMVEPTLPVAAEPEETHTCDRCKKTDIPESECAHGDGVTWCNDCCYDAPEETNLAASPKDKP